MSTATKILIAMVFIPVAYTLLPFPAIVIPAELIDALSSEIVLRFFSIAYLIMPIKFIMECVFLVLFVCHFDIVMKIYNSIVSWIKDF